MLQTQSKKAQINQDNVEQMDKNLAKVLTSDQCDILTSNKQKKYSAETLRRARDLKNTCGYSTYLNLKHHGFPLPNIRSLRRSKLISNDEEVTENIDNSEIRTNSMIEDIDST